MNSFNKSEPLTDVEKIELPGRTISSRDELIEIVESPILEACKKIYDLNIKTIFSSANPAGGYYIWFSEKSLSSENQRILLENGGKVGVLHGSLFGEENIMISPDFEPQSVKEISDWANGIASKLKWQELSWGGFTIKDLESVLGGMSEDDYAGKDKITYWSESEYFYNSENEMFYSSQEMLNKSQQKKGKELTE